jgi:pre-mRNA-splicing helicase BRR2
MASEDFAKLVSIGKQITDFTDSTHSERAAQAVVFNESELSDYELRDETDDDLGEDTHIYLSLHAQSNEQEDGELDSNRVVNLDPKQIDAYWLQRELSKYYQDPLTSQKMAEEVLTILHEPKQGDCEDKLVALLEYDKFSLIKMLLPNRKKLVYCTKLARAEDTERKALEEEMSQDPELEVILYALKSSKSGDENF